MREQLTAHNITARLELAPLAGEGGYFRQTWVSPGVAAGPDPIGTAIYYLVTPDSWSALHRLIDDEVFHFYLGDPCVMAMASPDGEVREIRLGPDLAAGERVQHVVPAGWWQGTQLAPGGSWALLGTTMAPGFPLDGFELATPAALEPYDASARERLAPFLP
jgi:predicted cupin superfamily sugar epimerase